MQADVAIVGAGAAGLATAIFARRLNTRHHVLLLDGARRPGAKILVSGGSRCNVTNAHVTDADFHGGSRAAIRQVLRSLSVPATVTFFEEIGVPLHEEERGKLFPDSNRARDVLDALLAEAARVGVDRRDDHRVQAIARDGRRFALTTVHGVMAADRVVLATGGQSLPKSGSDGAGWTFARSLGHTIVPPVPALVPLVLDSASPLRHASISGVACDVELTAWIDRRAAHRVRGPMLWTHFGVSGPAALDISRHWTRAHAAGQEVAITMSLVPGGTFDAVDRQFVDLVAARSRASLHTLLSTIIPGSVAAALIEALNLTTELPAHRLEREDRRRLAHALVEWTLPVTGTRGYNYAEVTAGGVDLSEINPKTMESRVCPGLFLTGEVVDVDGRLGGFNFQWAWASAMTAARALAAIAEGAHA